MYVSMSRLRVPSGQADRLVAAFRDRAHLVDDSAGFVDLEVWRSDRDSDADTTELIMVSRWQNRESFTAYMRSDEHQTSHERIDADLDGAIQLERLEHLSTYDVVAR